MLRLLGCGMLSSVLNIYGGNLQQSSMSLGIGIELVFDGNDIMKLSSGMVFIWPTFFSTQFNFSYAYWPEPTFLHFSLTLMFWLASNRLLTTFYGFYEISYFFFVMQPCIILFCFFFKINSINIRTLIVSTFLKYLVFSRAYHIWKAKFVDPNWEVLIKSDFVF